MEGGQQSETNTLFAVAAANLVKICKISTHAGFLSGAITWKTVGGKQEAFQASINSSLWWASYTAADTSNQRLPRGARERWYSGRGVIAWGDGDRCMHVSYCSLDHWFGHYSNTVGAAAAAVTLSSWRHLRYYSTRPPQFVSKFHSLFESNLYTQIWYAYFWIQRDLPLLLNGLCPSQTNVPKSA